CIHDADGYGTVIYEAMQEGARARPRRRKVDIINLGLEPEEALKMGLEPEPVTPKRKKNGEIKKVPVAKYVPGKWQSWLQRNRVELNAMPTPVFLEWLDRKMAPHDQGKIVPPREVLESKLREETRSKLSAEIKNAILQGAGFERQVEEAVA